MSEARDRLIAAWSKLTKDVAAAVISHYDLHSGGARKKSGGFVIPRDTQCQPAATQIAGEVRVSIPPSSQSRDLHASPVRLLDVDPTAIRLPLQATLTRRLAAGQTTVLVSIDPHNPVGTYFGWLMDGSGASIAPFVIYLDGL